MEVVVRAWGVTHTSRIAYGNQGLFSKGITNDHVNS